MAEAPPCSTPEHRQFDFWVGEWEVYDYSSGQKGRRVGHNRIVKIMKDCALQENWESVQGNRGTSYNAYFAPEGKWHQTWVDENGTVLLLSGEFRDGEMVLSGSRPGSQPGVRMLDRITWSLLDGAKDQVRQLWEVSRDGGQTWEVVFDGLYERAG